MGKLERLNKHIRSQHRMTVKVTLAIRDKETDGALIVKQYQHVKDIGLMNNGVYILVNTDDLPIAHFPIGLVVAVECPEHDTNISIVPGKQVRLT